MIQVFEGFIFYSCWSKRTLLFKLIKCFCFFFFLFGAIRTKPDYCLINCWQLLSPFPSLIICYRSYFHPSLRRCSIRLSLKQFHACVRAPPPAWGSLHVQPACVRTCLPKAESRALSCWVIDERTYLEKTNVGTQILLFCIYKRKDKGTREVSDEERNFVENKCKKTRHLKLKEEVAETHG